ncbi:hypothetical protein AC579_9906 [Pseudocercospora musae]|uniref:Uncharacterized protein n=1 Tax=Pseudocercospora musae TaxID=113226 RepID=A0A139IFH1_9PEZI|nr:hypothetical protein AC579_9906 [Pseudocercospora musae]KXT13431.1 hypothetical protein AC579_9906 [Pseudocercospora musae]KXT13433.1 hypothetical protein AC579_9906 [Pseudocercospora musae]
MSRGYSDGSDMHEQSVHENFDVQRERHKLYIRVQTSDATTVYSVSPVLGFSNFLPMRSRAMCRKLIVHVTVSLALVSIDSPHHHSVPPIQQPCRVNLFSPVGITSKDAHCVLTSNRFAGTRETAVNCCSLLFTSLARERKKRAAKIVQTFSRWPSHCLWASVTQADHLPTFNTSQIDLSGAKKMKLDSSISTALAFGFSIFGFVAAAPPCIHIGKGPCIPHDVGYKAVGKTNKPAGKPVLSTETLGTIGIINNEMASPSTACTYGPLGCKTKRMQLPGPS